MLTVTKRHNWSESFTVKDLQMRLFFKNSTSNHIFDGNSRTAKRTMKPNWWNQRSVTQYFLFLRCSEKHFRSFSAQCIQSSVLKISINKCYFQRFYSFQPVWFKFVRKRKFQVADLNFFIIFWDKHSLYPFKEEYILDFMNERPTLEFSLFIEMAKQNTNGYEAGSWFLAPDVN